MSSDESPSPVPVQKRTLTIKPWVEGARTPDRVLLRLRDEARYLRVSRAERDVLAEITFAAPTVEQFLGRHFSGQGGLSFKEAVALLARLADADAIAGLDAAAKAELLAFARTPVPEASWLARFARRAWALLDAPLLRFREASWGPGVATVGRALVAPAGLAAQLLVLVSLLAWASAPLAGTRALARALIAEPEALLLKALLAATVALTLTNVLHLLAAIGSGVRFVGGSLRLTAFAVLNFAVDDGDVGMLPRRAQLRYRCQAMLAPFLLAGLCAAVPASGDEVPFSQVLGFAFLVVGALHVCPLLRGQLVKLGEDVTVSEDLIDRSNAFLARGLFRGIIGPGAAARGKGEAAAEAWLVAFACWSLTWLYGASLFFSEAFLDQLPALADRWFTLLQAGAGGRGRLLLASLASLFLIGLLGLAALLPMLRFAAVLLENIYAVTRLPLRKARAGLVTDQGLALPPDAAVGAFLRTIPVLSHLSDEALAKLGRHLRFKRYRRNAPIITQGEEGRAFFILAQGEASVVVESQEGVQRVVDVLQPGDSFGEIALVENVARTATVRAKTAALTLILDRRQFDAVFPEGGPERASLTRTIRWAKLVSDAKAFSHFTPAEVRTFLREVEPVRFAPGTTFIQEGTAADAAYLIEHGHARVVRAGDGVTMAVLGRGELVGTIALVKETARTASVVAETEVAALRIGKDTFRRLCLLNPLVALLVSDEADRQLGELEAS